MLVESVACSAPGSADVEGFYMGVRGTSRADAAKTRWIQGGVTAVERGHFEAER